MNQQMFGSFPRKITITISDLSKMDAVCLLTDNKLQPLNATASQT